MCRQCFFGCEFHRRRCPVRRPCVRQYKRCCPRIRPLFAAINGLTQPPERFKQSKSPQLACGVFFIFSPCFFCICTRQKCAYRSIIEYFWFFITDDRFCCLKQFYCFIFTFKLLSRKSLAKRTGKQLDVFENMPFHAISRCIHSFFSVKKLAKDGRGPTPKRAPTTTGIPHPRPLV